MTTSEDSVLLYRGGFLFLGVAVAVVIAAAVHSTAGPLGRVLSLPPLRALGLISYGVYLWHWPIYLVLTPGRTGWEGHGLFVVRVLATLAIATASYFLVEMPIRRGAFRRWKASWTLAPAGAISLAVVLVLVTRGTVSPAATILTDPMPQIDSAANPAPIRVIVIGDSVGLSMISGLKQVGPEWNLAVWSRTMVGCGFLDVDMEYDSQYKLSKKMAELCNEWHRTWQADLEAFQPDVVVAVFGGDMFDRPVNGSLLEAGTPEWEAYVLDGLQRQLDVLSSQGAKLVLATYPCSKSVLWALLSDGAEREQDAYRRTTELNEVYRKFAARNPDRVVLVDLNLLSCPEGRFTDLVIDGVRMREDGVHFTPAGSVVVARWLAPQIAAVAARERPLRVAEEGLLHRGAAGRFALPRQGGPSILECGAGVAQR